MTGSCHTVPVKLGALIRREGRDPQAIMSMSIFSPVDAVSCDRTAESNTLKALL
jgi:hypothetical protein